MKRISSIYGKSKSKSNKGMLDMFGRTNTVPGSERNSSTSGKNILKRTTTFSSNKKVKITNTIAQYVDTESQLSGKSPAPFNLNLITP